MKRLTPLLLASLCLAIPLKARAAVCGDVNGDQQVNIADATLTLGFAVGLRTPTADQVQNADVNHNGKIDTADATLLLQAAVGAASLEGKCASTPSGPALKTVVGDPNALLDGDIGVARFQNPSSVAFDSKGNMIIADLNNHAIRMISPQGQVSTIAGHGVAGYKDGPVDQALLGDVWQVRVGPDDSIYFADSSNLRVRKISADHTTVSTLAGAPDLDAQGNPKPGHKDGPGNAAQFSFPVGLAIDGSGNVFVADVDDNTIRKIASDGMNTVSTVAGTGQLDFNDGDALSASFRNPWGLAFAKNGDLYISDSMNELIRILTTQGQVTTFSGNPDASSGEPLPGFMDGPQDQAQFGSPLGIAFGGDTLYVADADLFFGEPSYRNGRIRALDTMGTVTTVAGSDRFGLVDAKGTAAVFDEPIDIAPRSDGALFVADYYNDAIRGILPDGTIGTLTGRPALGYVDGPGLQARLYIPEYLGGDGKGNVYIADYGNNRIRQITASGTVTTVIGNDRINGAGGYKDGRAAFAQINGPSSIAVGPDGSLYFTDRDNNRVRKVDTHRIVSTVAGSGVAGFADGAGTKAQFSVPADLKFGPDGNLYVSDSGNHRIRKITPDGTVTTVAGSGQAGSQDGTAAQATFDDPEGLAIAPDGTIYVADSSSENIRKIDPQGSVTTYAGSPPIDSNGIPQGAYQDGPAMSAQFSGPAGLALAGDGTLYVADQFNNRIRKIAPDGTVSTVAGIADSGYWDGPTTIGRLLTPFGLLLNADGSLLISDLGNHRIRHLTF